MSVIRNGAKYLNELSPLFCFTHNGSIAALWRYKSTVININRWRLHPALEEKNEKPA